jgi:L,D-transpeptidase ErfK/SrfK
MRKQMTRSRIPIRRHLAFLAGLLLPVVSTGEVYRLPGPGNDLIGQMQSVTARDDETLIDIARDNSLGQDEIVMANPTVDRWLPKGGTKVTIPRQFILPDAPRVGIVLNIPEMRLYFFPGQYETVVSKPAKPVAAKPVAVKSDRKPGEARIAKNPKKAGQNKPSEPAQPPQSTVVMKGNPTEVITYPVSIGRMDWRTPLGAAKIAEKLKDPVWRPPESIKKEHAKDGDFLPDVVPAGPMNPLGQFAMRLSVPGYLIHGTGVDKAYGIGMRVTHGCIRMYPEDIAKLYPLVNVGTPVRLVNQPVKLGWEGDDLYMEVHQPLDEDRMSESELLRTAMELIDKQIATRGVTLNGAAVREAVEKPTGIPVLISKAYGTYQPGEAAGSSAPLPSAKMIEPTPPAEPQPARRTEPEPEPYREPARTRTVEPEPYQEPVPPSVDTAEPEPYARTAPAPVGKPYPPTYDPYAAPDAEEDLEQEQD